jgi:predicted deacylase
MLLCTPFVHAAANSDYTTFMDTFKSLANTYPALVSYETVGETVDNNDIIMFKIGNPEGGRVLFDGAIHGLEIGGSEILYDYADWLLTSSDPLAKQILARDYTLLIPVVNVDSFNVTRVNADEVDLNRNFATDWANSGDNTTGSEYYHGPSPLSEPESQTMVSVFETFKPQFYVNLHTGGGLSNTGYYLTSTYGNEFYYASTINRIDSMSQAQGITPYPNYTTAGPGFAISDAARLGITSFLLELTNQGSSYLRFTSTSYETAIFQKFLPIAEVLSQECETGGEFEDGFESGNFTAWNGTYSTPGGTATVVNTLSYQGNYSAQFTSNGTGGYEEAYCYENEPACSNMYASGYFYVSESGIAENNDSFYLIEFWANGNDVAAVGWQRNGGVDEWALMVRNATDWISNYFSDNISLNEWYNIQLYWTAGLQDGSGELYVDGVLACSIQNLNTTAYGGFDQVRFGLAEVYGAGATTIYTDSCRIFQDPPWDVNQDGAVDMHDISIVARAFGSTPSSPNWNPAADVNGDGTVNMADLAMVVRHFGEHYF